MLDEFGIGARPILLQMRKGAGGYHSKRKMCVIDGEGVYVAFIHPDDYWRFLEVVGTFIEGKRHLIEFSMKIIKHCMVEYRI